MTVGEYFIFGFVAVIFFLGIYLGIKLFKWNQSDMKEKLKNNELKRLKKENKNQ